MHSTDYRRKRLKLTLHSHFFSVRHKAYVHMVSRTTLFVAVDDDDKSTIIWEDWNSAKTIEKDLPNNDTFSVNRTYQNNE